MIPCQGQQQLSGPDRRGNGDPTLTTTRYTGADQVVSLEMV
jgi:hypothetical protein